MKSCSYSIFIKYKNLSFESFIKKLKNRKLKTVLKDLMHFVQNYPMLLLLLIFGYIDERNADYPICGSQGIAELVKNRLLSLGGEIKFNSQVTEVLTKKHQAVGIRLADNSLIKADYVVSCSDGYNTLFNMLGCKYLTKRISRQYASLPIFLSYTQFSYGLSIDLGSQPQFIIYKLDEPVILGNEKIEQIRIRHYCFNQSFAPRGQTSLVVTFASGYDYWNQLYENNKDLYKSEKKKIDKEIRKVLKKRFKINKRHIIATDIATPKTFERYTQNRNGSAEGWYTTAKTIDEKFDYCVKGLDNFYMASHWTGIHGGITFAALYGRNVAQIICQNEKVIFRE